MFALFAGADENTMVVSLVNVNAVSLTPLTVTLTSDLST